MKRFFHGLLAAAIIIGNVAADTHTNKTFLMPRPNGMNMAMEYSTWHKQTSMIDDEKFGGSIQATGFYEESENKSDLAQYFGVRNWDNNNSIDPFLVVVPEYATATQPAHIGAGFMFHASQVSTGAIWPVLADKITWAPYRQAYGVRLDYHQKLDKLLKGLYFKVSMPIAHVKTSMGYSSTCGCGPCGGCDPCSTSTPNYCVRQRLTDDAGAFVDGTEKSVIDYLTGNVENTSTIDAQEKLCFAKIHNGNSDTGIADIDFILGYNFWYEKEKHLNVNIGVTVPTGNKPDGEFLFPAIVGNAGHWALGFGLDSSFELWRNNDSCIDLLLACNYRYLFSSTEKRTMGFTWPNGATLTANGWNGQKARYGHWWLGAKLGATTTTPMANFLTRDIKVTPGSHFEGIVQLAYNTNNWTFDLGYNLFAREEDDLKLDCGSCTPCESTCSTGCSTECGGWTDDTYAVASDEWETNVAFASVADHLYIDDTDFINAANLCLDACRQPSVVTHKLYGAIGYAFNEWDYPLMLGIGGSYEWETDNDCVDGWALWAKVGLTF